MDIKTPINLSVLPPVMSQQQFSSFTGVSPGTVRGWVEGRTLPIVKIGKQRFINLVLFSDELSNGKSIFCRGDFS